jgi:RNA-directed DNA polymerase
MTTAQAVGAVSREAAEWYAIDWQAINRNVRRLQVRIVQATKEGRWGKVRALQRLLTHSYSGKVLAVRRVTENTGKKTPGVDREIWDTPEKKTQAVHELKHRGYQPRPLRRVYIPKSDGKTMRPLGIPTMIEGSKHYTCWPWTPLWRPKLIETLMGFVNSGPAPMRLNSVSTH